MRKQLEVATQIGLRPSDFWRMTPGDFSACLRGYRERMQNRQRAADQAAWMGGYYAAVACNDPKRYPNKPIFFPEETPEQKIQPMSEEEMKNTFKAMARRG